MTKYFFDDDDDGERDHLSILNFESYDNNIKNYNSTSLSDQHYSKDRREVFFVLNSKNRQWVGFHQKYFEIRTWVLSF